MDKQPQSCHVWIREPILGRHVLSLDDFLSFPLDLRARLIADGATQFFRASGTLVPLSQTIESIVAAWTSEFDQMALAGGASTEARTPVGEATIESHDEACGWTGACGERRRFARTSMIRPVRVLLGSTARERFAISEDVSPGGLRFRARGEFAPGDRVTVQWSESDDDSEEIYEATVVRCGRDQATAATLFPRRVAVVFNGRAPIGH